LYCLFRKYWQYAQYTTLVKLTHTYIRFFLRNLLGNILILSKVAYLIETCYFIKLEEETVRTKIYDVVVFVISYMLKLLNSEKTIIM